MINTKPSGVFFGHIVGAVAATVFFIANSTGLDGVVRIVLVLIGIIGLGITIYAAAKTPKELQEINRDTARTFRGAYIWVMLVTLVALFGGFQVINLFNEVSNVAWIAFIVGLHFIVLSYTWLQGNENMRNLGLAMGALGVVGLIIGFTTNDIYYVALVSGIGSGVCLLVSSLIPSLTTIRHYH